MEQMKKGIKESLELIEGLGECGVTLRKLKVVIDKIREDGKVDASDILHLGGLMDAAPDFDKIDKAVEGADEVLEELKDLEKDETFSLMEKMYSEAKRINEA